jgi:hypothetical protein
MSRLECTLYFLAGAVILLMTLGHGWMRVQHQTFGTVTAVLSFLGVVCSAGLFVASWRPSRWARFLFFSVISASACVWVLELTLQIANYPPEPLWRSDAYRHRLVALKKINTLIRLRENNVHAFLSVPPRDLKMIYEKGNSFLPLSNISNARLVLGEEDDGMITFQSDEIGFRNPPGLYHNSERFDVILLGDSFTEGACVPDGFTIADHIRNKTDFTVYNAGKGGTGLIHSVATFVEYGLVKQPQNVVLLLVEGSTLHRTLNELEYPMLGNYLKEQTSQELLGRMELQDDVLRGHIKARTLVLARDLLQDDLKPQGLFNLDFYDLLLSFFENSRVYGLTRYWIATSGWLDPTHSGEGYPPSDQTIERKAALRKVLAFLDGRIREYGGKLIVVYLPDMRFFFKNWPDGERQSVIALLDELDVPLVDLVGPMEQYEDPKTLIAKNAYSEGVGGHYNREGYALVGDQIVTVLTQSN